MLLAIATPKCVECTECNTCTRWHAIVVNTAGIEKKFAFVDYPFDEWQETMAVNLAGAFLCSQAAARQMIAQGGGRIINISSIHEGLPLLTNALYCAPKAASAC